MFFIIAEHSDALGRCKVLLKTPSSYTASDTGKVTMLVKHSRVLDETQLACVSNDSRLFLCKSSAGEYGLVLCANEEYPVLFRFLFLSLTVLIVFDMWKCRSFDVFSSYVVANAVGRHVIARWWTLV